MTLNIPKYLFKSFFEGYVVLINLVSTKTWSPILISGIGKWWLLANFL